MHAILAAGALLPLVAGIGAAWLAGAVAVARRPLVGAALSGVLAVAVSAYLVAQHHAAAGRSFCSVSETFDCDSVNRSVYSEVAGIPVALLGLAFYVGVVVVAVLGARRREGYRHAGAALFLGGALAVLYSVFLAAMSARLGKWCLFCIALYGLNALVLAGGLLAERREGGPLAERLGDGVAALFRAGERSLWTMAGAGALALVVGMFAYERAGGAASGSGGQAGAGGPDPAALAALYEQARGPVELDGTEPVLGRADAPITVVEFGDFQCPSCARAVPDVLELAHRRPDVRVLFKHYPISGICNPQVEGPRHRRSCAAAYAAECARQQGRFWELEKLMFANQQFLEDDDIRFMARQAGLDVDTLFACMEDPRTKQAVLADVQAAGRAGVTFTPSFFVHGLFGDDWVLVPNGPLDILAILEARDAGLELPPPGPPRVH